MAIWSKNTRKVISLFLDSTGRRYCFSEVLTETRVSRSSLSSILDSLTATGYLYREKERDGFDSFGRAKRVYYCLTADGINRIRLPQPERVIFKTSV
jgi:hypothetical protein